MAGEVEKKLFVGGRLKRLRRDLGLTQTRMAEDLGVSASYLNLLERNQRPVTAQVLLRLAETYDLDLKALSLGSDSSDSGELSEVFSDPLFSDLNVPRHEISELGQNAPGAAEAIVRLYQAYLDRRRLSEMGGLDPSEMPAGAVTPSGWVRDVIQGQRNYFPELDECGETIAADLSAEPHDFATRARERLTTHNIQVRVLPPDVIGGFVHRFDQHRKRVMLSETLVESGRFFALAYHIALAEQRELVAKLVERATPPDRPSRNLLTVMLLNYLAAAILMPYARFHETAEKLNYDVDGLCVRFGVGFEQACHRLTTLARPGARGIPFFMLRLDWAGNISKRFASAAFPFSRFGGTCPRWNIHATFKTPGRIITQIVETTDGARYFTFSRTVHRMAAPEGEDDLAIGMGCELKFASRLGYARGFDLATPVATGIGPACRICERPACPQRAAEPIARTMSIDDFAKPVSPYPF